MVRTTDAIYSSRQARVDRLDRLERELVEALALIGDPNAGGADLAAAGARAAELRVLIPDVEAELRAIEAELEEARAVEQRTELESGLARAKGALLARDAVPGRTREAVPTWLRERTQRQETRFGLLRELGL